MKKLLFSMSLLVILAACGKEEAATPSLQVSPGEIEMESVAGDKDVNVTANVNWTVSSAATDWCTVSPASGNGNGSFKVTVKANTALTSRETKITVKADNITREITVTQNGASLEAVLSGSKWEIISQATGDPNFDDLVGTVVDFKADKKAVVDLHLDLGVIIEKMEGTWSVAGETITISGELLDTPTDLTIKIDEMSELVMNARLNTNLPLGVPEGGIPVVFKKI